MAEVKKYAPENYTDYIREMKNSLSVVRWVWEVFVPEEGRRYALGFMALLSVSVAIFMIQPLFIGWIIDSLEGREVRWAATLVGILLAVGLVRRTGDLFRDLAREWVINRLVLETKMKANKLFHEKTLGQHIAEGTELNHANLEKAQRRVFELQGMLLFEVGHMGLMLLSSYVFLWFLRPLSGLVITGLLLFNVLYSFYLNYQVAVNVEGIEKDFRAHNRELIERWEKVERVKTSGKTWPEHGRLTGWLEEILDRDWTFWSWFIRMNLVKDFVGLAVQTAIVAYGVYGVLYLGWQIGIMVPLYTWTNEIVRELWSFGHYQRRLSDHVPYIRSLKKALTTAPLFEEEKGREIGRDIPLSVRFERVSLTYKSKKGGEVPVLRDISFTINPGEKVALIGPSGAGKSTIMKLLLRFMDPTEGEIWINGYRLQDVRHSSWMQKVGYIPQESQIFDATLRYNLDFALSERRRQEIEEEEIWGAMRELQSDFGERLNQGLETLVGRNGTKLSGGEKQRVMATAMVLKKPIFMVIDEATSSLDSTTEKMVQRGLERALESHVGALIVAHRLSTVREICNRFMVLKPISEVMEGESQIEAKAGSFEELYAISPTFRRLADDQEIVIRGHAS